MKNILIKSLKEEWLDLSRFVRGWWIYHRQSVKMGYAIRLADLKQRAYNKQYHVLMFSMNGKQKVVTCNNRDINRFRRMKLLPKEAGMLELKNKNIFYSTPENRNNRSTWQEREAAKRKYLAFIRKQKTA
jgi:hypothetical protein